MMMMQIGAWTFVDVWGGGAPVAVLRGLLALFGIFANKHKEKVGKEIRLLENEE